MDTIELDETIIAELDQELEPTNGCNCCSMCAAGSHCYIPPCTYA